LCSRSVKATFFILGWVAENCPELVKRIAAEGHEIASHGYTHQRVCNQSRQEFRKDIRRSKKLLEDITGQSVIGYRAPSYSISQNTLWAFDEISEAGYKYDSSIFPIVHDYYGIPDWPRFAKKVVKNSDGNWVPGETENDDQPFIIEFPITPLYLAGCNVPICGGGYFRFYPYPVTRWGLQRINRVDNQPFVFYIHPWELDPSQPRMPAVGLKSKLRHYLNLHKTEDRFKMLLQDFNFTKICDGLNFIQRVPET
jgi:polysaccharide deacetylase family protein (PEP-CTERM system associated)